MAIEDTRELKTVTSESAANELLGDGWTLLALFDHNDGGDQYTEYHLGWQGAAEDAAPVSGGVILPKRMQK